MTAVLIIVAAIGLVLACVAVGYNSLVRKRNRTKEAWSQIDVELKRRHDLIPNLVRTVQGYAAHEKSTFEAVTASRAGAVAAGATSDPKAVAEAEGTLSRTLRSLFAVAENYPALQAESEFKALQEQLDATEDKLEYARRYYNTSARDYDTAIESFPRSLFAGPFGFHPAEFFESDAEDREAPVVDFAAAPPAA